MIRRLTLFVLFTALLVVACVWLADRPGTVTIHWQGWRIDTTVPVVLFFLAGLLALFVFAGRLLRFLVDFPSRWLMRRRFIKQRKGYLALTDGMAAVAGGDAEAAKKFAKKAQALLDDEQVTGLLAAQAAGLAGDDNAAREHFQALLVRPETALSGCQGMMALALKQDNREQALDWARRAWATGTRVGVVAETLYDLQARAGQWAEAELTVVEAVRRKAMTKAKSATLRAVALTERALRVAPQAAGSQHEAMALILSAHRADTAFVPAAVLASRLLVAAGKLRKANSVLADAWKRNPHPDLASAWRDLVPDEAPLTRFSRLQKVLNDRIVVPEAHLVLARAALDAQMWGQARGHLEALLKDRPTRSVFLLLANLEREERHDAKAVAHWTEQANSALADDDWRCVSCNGHTQDWKALCPHCGRASTLIWTGK
jgi:HemY protein